MDENRLKKIAQSALDNSYSGLTISEFRALETSEFNDDMTWKPYSYTLFITLKRGENLYEGCGKTFSTVTVETFLESLIGYECCVDFS